ncbi:hypothetical protein ACWZEH_16980 [Streptomyces sp. QTS137]
MADPPWDDVSCFSDPDPMGTLPDLCVPEFSAQDWRAVLDLVVARGREGGHSECGTVLPIPRAEAAPSRPADAEHPVLRVRPAVEVSAILRFRSVDAIGFDVELRELRGQERLDVFRGFLRALGRRLGEPVGMGTEAEGGDGGRPVPGYDVGPIGAGCGWSRWGHAPGRTGAERAVGCREAGWGRGQEGGGRVTGSGVWRSWPTLSG